MHESLGNKTEKKVGKAGRGQTKLKALSVYFFVFFCFSLVDKHPIEKRNIEG